MNPQILEDYKRFKEGVTETGIISILIVTFSYFMLLFLIPIGILSLLVWIFKIPMGGGLISIVAAITFIGYFAFDLLRVMSGKYTLTVAAMIGLLIVVILTIKTFKESIKMINLDDETPNQIKRRIFPLYFIC